MPNWTMHIEKSRSWWNGTSTTLCGLTITKVEKTGYWWTGTSVTCPACKAIKRGGR
ncbi:hypothetical protein C8D87_11747 [Lentzea atacamensis]|uniref:Uncharacterized protein n=1 Tax=Lentzea atacamensis TaxID=531938 RepID=A0ABX9DX67_9PSEU|nr:hypothetical protein [Lentzea atacamensis]RAS58877.1 hypothetical protein C8D87_11747 [Lentzea atacamensis]